MTCLLAIIKLPLNEKLICCRDPLQAFTWVRNKMLGKVWLNLADGLAKLMCRLLVMDLRNNGLSETMTCALVQGNWLSNSITANAGLCEISSVRKDFKLPMSMLVTALLS